MNTQHTSPRPGFSRGWKLFLAISFLLGLVLRLIFVNDMEYKEDEEFNFNQSQLPGWPWIGMPSGVFIPNPGMSIWVFRALALISHSTTPTQLARALQVFSALGISLLIPFALWFVRRHEARTHWLWAAALAYVNPFAVFYQRKLWPEPFLPFFTMLALMSWWRRDLWLGAFFWGLIGACLGQIHMSGFFLSAAFLLCTVFLPAREISRTEVKWSGWFIGSVLGALPLIPWILSILQHPTGQPIGKGWDEVVQAKFWVFWTTNPLGLHLGNPIGLMRGQTTWAQLSDFVRYPVIGGQATYLNLLAHLVIVGVACVVFAFGLRRVPGGIRQLYRRRLLPLRERSDLQLALLAGTWGFGLLMTASSIAIRRYYMMVSFPLDFVWLVRLTMRWAKGDLVRARRLLLILWASELFVSACFVGYIHVNRGSLWGDYGDAYHVIMKARGTPVSP